MSAALLDDERRRVKTVDGHADLGGEISGRRAALETHLKFDLGLSTPATPHSTAS